MASGKTPTVGVDTPFLVAHTVLEHPDHARTNKTFLRLLDKNQRFALCPTVIDEFLHVVTDPKRFEKPLEMNQAIQIARTWLNSRETLYCLPSEQSQLKQLDWMVEHRLGRKRINDTRIASIYFVNGVTQLLTANVRDYSIFEVFDIVDH